MKKIIFIIFLLMTFELNSCVSIVTNLNERKHDEIYINKKKFKTKQKINLDVIKNDIKIFAIKTNEYIENKDIFLKGSKEFNLVSASASGWTFTISGVILTLFFNSSLTKSENPIGNPHSVYWALAIMSVDLLLGAILGNMDKTSESTIIVEENIFRRCNYNLIIGEKNYNGTLDENGNAIIENVHLNKEDFEYGNAKLNIFVGVNKIFTEEIEVEKLNSLIN